MATLTYTHTDVASRIASTNVSNLRYHVATTTWETASSLVGYGTQPNSPVVWTPVPDALFMYRFVSGFIAKMAQSERMDSTLASLYAIDPNAVITDLQTSLAF